MTLSAGVLATALCEKVSGAPVGAMLIINTVKAAVGLAASTVVASGWLSAQAITLAEETVTGMGMIKGKLVAILLVIGLGIGGVGLAGYRALTQKDMPAAEADVAQTPPSKGRDLEQLKKDSPTRTDLNGDLLPMSALARLGSLCFRHEGQVYSLAMVFSPDDKTLAASTSEGIVLWDAASGKELHRFHGQGHGAIDFSPDGKMLAATDGKETVLFDIATGKRVLSVNGAHQTTSEIRIAFSPDGKTLAAHCGAALGDPSWKAFVMLLDAATGKERLRLDKIPSYVCCLAFSPDSKTVAVGLINPAVGKTRPCVLLYDVNSGKLISAIEHELITLAGAIAFSPDGNLLAYGWRNRIVVAEATGTKVLKEFEPAMESSLDYLAFLPDGQSLAACQRDAKVQVWDLKLNNKRLDWHTRIEQHNANATIVSRNGKMVAAGTRTGSAIRFWDLTTGEEKFAAVRGHDSPMQAVAFLLDGKRLASGGRDGIRLWEAATGKHIMHLTDSGAKVVTVESDKMGSTGFMEVGGVKGLVASPDGKRLAAIGAATPQFASGTPRPGKESCNCPTSRRTAWQASHSSLTDSAW